MKVKRVVRRKHSAEFRAEVVHACRQRGASVAAVALRHGLNASLVHRWLSQDLRSLVAEADGGAVFVPVELPAPAEAAPSSDIRIELRRGSSTVTVNWPLQGGRDCAAWLREWLQ